MSETLSSAGARLASTSVRLADSPPSHSTNLIPAAAEANAEAAREEAMLTEEDAFIAAIEELLAEEKLAIAKKRLAIAAQQEDVAYTKAEEAEEMLAAAVKKIVAAKENLLLAGHKVEAAKLQTFYAKKTARTAKRKLATADGEASVSTKEEVAANGKSAAGIALLKAKTAAALAAVEKYITAERHDKVPSMAICQSLPSQASPPPHQDAPANESTPIKTPKSEQTAEKPKAPKSGSKFAQIKDNVKTHVPKTVGRAMHKFTQRIFVAPIITKAYCSCSSPPPSVPAVPNLSANSVSLVEDRELHRLQNYRATSSAENEHRSDDTLCLPSRVSFSFVNTDFDDWQDDVEEERCARRKAAVLKVADFYEAMSNRAGVTAAPSVPTSYSAAAEAIHG